jgi:hypothetical protein
MGLRSGFERLVEWSAPAPSGPAGRKYRYNPAIGALVTNALLVMIWFGMGLICAAVLYVAVRFIHWAWNTSIF